MTRKKPAGWRGEPRRHAQAARGVKTTPIVRRARIRLRSFTQDDKYAWFGSGTDPQIARGILAKEGWPSSKYPPFNEVGVVTVIADITGIGVHAEEEYFFKRTGSRKKAIEIANSLSVPIDVAELKRKGFKYRSY